MQQVCVEPHRCLNHACLARHLSHVQNDSSKRTIGSVVPFHLRQVAVETHSFMVAKLYLVARSEDQVCAKSFQQDAPFCAHGVRHCQNQLVAFSRSYVCKTHTSIAAGWLNLPMQHAKACLKQSQISLSCTYLAHHEPESVKQSLLINFIRSA